MRRYREHDRVTISETIAPPEGWLTLDPVRWRASYARQPFTISHGLAGHPLLTFDAVCDLVSRFPEDQINHNLGDIPEVLPRTAPRLDQPPTDIIRGLEHNGCWMAIWYIMQDPAYHELCNQVLDQVAAALGPGYDTQHREAYLFLSGTSSVTPSHCDPEHNFLLQVRGNKAFTVAEPPDRDQGQRFLEHYYRHGEFHTPYSPVNRQEFDLAPGVGIYVPPHRPHLVRSRSGLTLSLSVTWRPRDLRREGRVYAFNGRRREHGATPRPVGELKVRDWTKATYEGSLSRIRRGLGRGRGRGLCVSRATTGGPERMS